MEDFPIESPVYSYKRRFMQKLLLTDYATIQPYLDDANYEGYNSNFVTMMMWDHVYHVQYEVHDHFLVMLQDYKDTFFFAMPFCKKKYVKDAIEYMIRYANKHNIPFLIDGVTSEIKDYIQTIYKKDFIYEATPNNDDYIYSKEALETLRGKKMQKRRNHYNAFIKNYPNFLYKEIEDSDIHNVLSCLQHWEHEYEGEESIQLESVGIMYLLKNRDALSIATGCIYINGVLEAFIIGSPLKHETVQIHVEKANKDIRGLYVAICKFFLENNYSSYNYVNREEDMGIPALKKAKKALHPIAMVHKYRITFRKTSVRQATPEDTIRVQELWRTCFIDENEKSTSFYFKYCYQAEHTYLLLQEDTIISTMQIVPYTLESNEIIYFILGVCTKPEFQNNSCMKELMQTILAKQPYQSHRIFLQAYVPAIYHQFGFYERYYLQNIKVKQGAYEKIDSVFAKHISAEAQLTLYQQYCTHFQGYRVRNLTYYEVYLKQRCLAFNETLIGIYNKDALIGYTIYNEDDITITISEIIYTSQSNLDMIVSYFACQEKNVVITCDLKANIYGESRRICSMMTNDEQTETINTNLYINELY